jgi:hypothetical protein
VERLGHRIKTKRKTSQNKQGIPPKIEEARTLNKVLRRAKLDTGNGISL